MENTELRKELIDFISYCKKVDTVWAEEFGMWIDDYLEEKSINSSPSESQSVVDNEDKEKSSGSVQVTIDMGEYAVWGGKLIKVTK